MVIIIIFTIVEIDLQTHLKVLIHNKFQTPTNRFSRSLQYLDTLITENAYRNNKQQL